MLALAGCRPKYVTLPKETTSETNKVKIIRDTLRQRDSVIIHEVITQQLKGDTVYIYKVRKERVKSDNDSKAMRIDTVYINRATKETMKPPDDGVNLPDRVKFTLMIIYAILFALAITLFKKL